LRLINLIFIISLLTNVAIGEEKNQIIVNFSSEQDELLDIIKSLVTTTQLSCDSAKWKVNQSLHDDIEDIQQAVHAYGYYHLQLQRSVTQKNNCWLVDIKVLEGPRTHFKEIDVVIEGQAKEDKDFIKSIQTDSIQIGEPLLHRRYEELKKGIESIAAKRGYFDGRFSKKQLKIDAKNNTAVIKLHYVSGDRYHFGEIITEQDALNDELFNKYIKMEPGKPFDDNQLVTTYQNLSSSGFFSIVDITPILAERANTKVPIIIKASKSKPKSYSIGIGASTDIGPHIRATHENRLVNKRGHSYRAELSLSPVISNANFSYRILGDKPQTDFYEFSTQAIHENTDTSTSDTFNLAASRSELIRNDWTRLISLQYSLDDFDVGEDNDTTMLLRPTLGFSKTQANSILRPTKGYRLNLEVTGAHTGLLSDINFIQTQFNTKFIASFTRSLRWLSRLDIGYTEVDNFSELPSNLRFFAGGDSSIRGYDFESLGPEDDAGDVVGGEALIIGSVEFDYLFTSNWSGALFVDAGNAFNDDQIDLNVGAGFGVRWQSPIGPIRVDIGFPVDDPDADDTWRLHFSLGPDL
jgi:translocation and assembly module TamA